MNISLIVWLSLLQLWVQFWLRFSASPKGLVLAVKLSQTSCLSPSGCSVSDPFAFCVRDHVFFSFFERRWTVGVAGGWPWALRRVVRGFNFSSPPSARFMGSCCFGYIGSALGAGAAAIPASTLPERVSTIHDWANGAWCSLCTWS